MAEDREFRAEVEAKLNAVVPVTGRAMFGGVGLYAEGRIFALLAEGKVYFKVSDLNRADFEAAGMGPFFPWDSPTPMGYWELPPGLLDHPEELAPWVEKALEVARQAALKKPARPRKPRTPRA